MEYRKQITKADFSLPNIKYFFEKLKKNDFCSLQLLKDILSQKD